LRDETEKKGSDEDDDDGKNKIDEVFESNLVPTTFR
jgi:hypothetical protein